MKKGKVDAQLTIFFGMVMTLILSMILTLIEGARYSALRLTIACVHDTAANSVMATYHREMFERYGLLFADTTKVESQVQEVLRKNLDKDIAGHLLGVRDLLALEIQDTRLEKARLATDDKGQVIMRQCVQCMEEKYGITYLEDMLYLFGIVEKQEILDEDRTVPFGEGEISETELNEELMQIKLEKTRIPDVFHWLEQEALVFLLGQREYSKQCLPLKDRVSERDVPVGAGMEVNKGFETNHWNKLLYIEYLLSHTGNYVSPLKDGLLKYQVEYLLNGKEADGANLWETATRLLEIRTSANMIGILSNEHRSAVLKELSVSLASSLGNPELEALLFSALLVIWAEVEGVYDVKLLLSGKGVSLIKTPEEWLLDVTWISEIVKAPAGENCEIDLPGEMKQSKEEAEQEKLVYEDYLRILLWFQNEQTIALRFMDIVESDIKSVMGQEDFCLEKYGDCFWIGSNLKSGYGGEFVISRKYEY